MLLAAYYYIFAVWNILNFRYAVFLAEQARASRATPYRQKRTTPTPRPVSVYVIILDTAIEEEWPTNFISERLGKYSQRSLRKMIYSSLQFIYYSSLATIFLTLSPPSFLCKSLDGK